MDVATFTATLATLAPVVGGSVAWLWSKFQASQTNAIADLTAKLESCAQEREDLSNRVTALEASLGDQPPTWRRTQDGTVLSVSHEFIRLFCAPYGLKASDVVGKRLEDIPVFTKSFCQALQSIDREVRSRGRATRHGVKITDDITVTIIKIATHTPTQDIVYVGYAVDEI